MRRARRNFICFAALWLAVCAEDDVEEENRVLKLRLQALQQELAKEGDEMQYSYLVVKGMIADAESVYMETMDIDEAKRYCNSNPECKGFSFEGPETRPEDEVTVMFKGGNKVNHDALWVSYVKESSLFGALNAATGSDDTSNPRIISQSITFNSIALALRARSPASSRARGGDGGSRPENSAAHVSRALKKSILESQAPSLARRPLRGRRLSSERRVAAELGSAAHASSHQGICSQIDTKSRRTGARARSTVPSGSGISSAAQWRPRPCRPYFSRHHRLSFELPCFASPRIG